ncbi:MAG: VCBS repeat-containing protein, partial [Nanoarchaeota archaeon]
MKRGQRVVSLIFLASVVVLLSISFVSAGWLSDFLGKFFGSVQKGPSSTVIASFNFSQKTNLLFDKQPYVGDLNNDGYEEILLFYVIMDTRTDRGIALFNYTGGLLWQKTWKGLYGANPVAALVDIDRDGYKELVISKNIGHYAVVGYNGIEQEINNSLFDINNLSSYIDSGGVPRICDLNQDGNKEIFTYHANMFYGFNNSGKVIFRRYEPRSDGTTTITFWDEGVFCLDINNDKFDDIILRSISNHVDVISRNSTRMGIYGNPPIQIFDQFGKFNHNLSSKFNASMGNYSYRPLTMMGIHPFKHAFGDLNLDGSKDIVSIYRSGYHLYGILAQTYNGTVLFNNKNYDGVKPIMIDDIDNDNIPEVIFVSAERTSYHTRPTVEVKRYITILDNKGNQIKKIYLDKMSYYSSFQTYYDTEYSSGFYYAELTDLTGDGKPEIIINTGSYGFSLKIISLSNGEILAEFPGFRTFITGDINKDNRKDLITVNNGKVEVFTFNNSDASFDNQKRILDRDYNTRCYGCNFNSSAPKNNFETSCTNDCTTSGIKQCSGNGFQTCGNYDSDVCLEWSSVSACSTGQTCNNGNCVGGTPQNKL